MEVRNFTQSCNSTSFGMALRKPAPENMERFVKALKLDSGNIGAKIRKAGLKQLEKEARNGKRFDVAYTVSDNGADTYQVIDNKFNKAVLEYTKGQEGLVKRPDSVSKFIQLQKEGCKNWKDMFKFSGAFLKVLANVAVNPKDSLPRALLTAAEKAKIMNEAAIRNDKARIIRNNAINDVNKIFDK